MIHIYSRPKNNFKTVTVLELRTLAVLKENRLWCQSERESPIFWSLSVSDGVRFQELSSSENKWEKAKAEVTP